MSDDPLSPQAWEGQQNKVTRRKESEKISERSKNIKDNILGSYF